MGAINGILMGVYAVVTPDIQNSAYSMKSLNNFQNSLSSDCELFHI